MGVPGLFSWVRKSFPTIVRQVRRDDRRHRQARSCDHLYIGDLNHVLHSCAHSLGMPRDKGPLHGIFGNIEKYIDLIVTLARPQRLLMLAVDGVAPQAKLTQQRTRRFLGVYRKQLEEQKKGATLRSDFEKEAGQRIVSQTSFDPNVITPGTPFMQQLTRLLREYVEKRLKFDQKWRDLKVLLSSANEPGEGEHKIMRFIKDQQSRAGYERETRHVVFGQDADLIVLALMTHEPHFRIFREKLPPLRKPPSGKLPLLEQMDIGHLRRNLKRFLEPSVAETELEKDNEEIEKTSPVETTPQVSESTVAKRPNFNYRKSLEDLVLLSFLIGNDFVPSIPSLDIYDDKGGMDLIIDCYKKVRSKKEGYLTDNGSIDAHYLREILELLAKDEISAYERIQNNLQMFKKLIEEKDAQLTETMKDDDDSAEDEESDDSKEEDKSKKKKALSDYSPLELNMLFSSQLTKEIDADVLADFDNDDLKLGSEGYEQRYYVSRHLAEDETEVDRVRQDVGSEYFRALCWSFAYYSVGTNPVATTADSRLHSRNCTRQNKREEQRREILYAAWDWSYPYHYAPLIKDLMDACGRVSSMEVYRAGAIRQLANGWCVNHGPVPPFVQLLSVLPPESADACLPDHLARLLKATRSDSTDDLRQEPCVQSIAQMFPEDLRDRVDAKGKRWAYTVILRLPPVDYNIVCTSARIVSESLQQKDLEEVGNFFACGELCMRMAIYQELLTSATMALATQTMLRKTTASKIDIHNAVIDPVLQLVIPAIKEFAPCDNTDEQETIRLAIDIAGAGA